MKTALLWLGVFAPALLALSYFKPLHVSRGGFESLPITGIALKSGQISLGRAISCPSLAKSQIAYGRKWKIQWSRWDAPGRSAGRPGRGQLTDLVSDTSHRARNTCSLFMRIVLVDSLILRHYRWVMVKTFRDRDPAAFDVMPANERWKVKTSDGRVLYSAATEKAALQFAWSAAMSRRPAKARLLLAGGEVVQEWHYAA
jgi:hypothetical protein